MMSQIPIDLKKAGKEDINREILRVGIMAELDAINLYEQLASVTENKNIRNVFMDIVKEEKTHMGEFQALLLRDDVEQKAELEKGEKEVRELIGE